LSNFREEEAKRLEAERLEAEKLKAERLAAGKSGGGMVPARLSGSRRILGFGICSYATFT